MTMNSITAKLRKKNKNQYSLLMFCVALSVMLVTSFALMYYSPTVQNIFPKGGDSRKQAIMIFVVAIVGCSVFTTYASSLFFRYKSREFGIFMALGEKKQHLKKVLLHEISVIVFSAAAIGLVASIPVSYGIWKVFQLFIIDTQEMAYQFSPVGFSVGVIFCIFVISCIFVMGIRFIKRSNLIEMITETRKAEAVKEIKPWCGKVGWLLFLSGIILGYLVPMFVVNFFNYLMPSIWNVTYGLAFVGIYMIMLYTVVGENKKDKSKYYKNILSINMMRFSANQTVRNMCVIALLISGALFAAFYTPVVVSGMFSDLQARKIDYAFVYPKTETQIQEDEIFALAETHDVKIINYNEIDTLNLIINGIERDYHGNHFVEIDHDKYLHGDFIKESDYEKVTGQEIELGAHEYYRVVSQEYQQSLWDKTNDLSLITHPETNESEGLTYMGVARFTGLSLQAVNMLYILSDEDYERLAQGIEDTHKQRIVMFNVEQPETTYAFAKALTKEIIDHSSEATAVISSYDNYQAELAREKGEVYWADNYSVDLEGDISALHRDWKFYPQFNVMSKQDLIKDFAVFLMLFIYIAIICFVAVIIIAYTRSVTIATDNKQVFRDLKRLGASNQYIERVIRKQLAKIFMYPTVVGTLAMYIFYFMIMWGNSGGTVTTSEYMALGINFAIVAGISGCMYGVYLYAMKKVKNVLDI